MITGIDHIVIAAPALERAMETYRGLGFSVVAGGRHPFGSHNALIGFADGSYIELISFYEPSPAHPWWDLLGRGGGLVDFCMATDDIRADCEAFRAQGVELGEITEGARDRPDGYRVEWINNKVDADWQGYIPFIIEDVTPRDERLPRQREHANGVSGIDCVTFAARDVTRYAAVMAAVLGVDGQAVVAEELGGRGVRYEVGGHCLAYLAPDADEGPLAAHLAAGRPAPYSVSFKTAGAAKAFDPAETEGVNLRLLSI